MSRKALITFVIWGLIACLCPVGLRAQKTSVGVNVLDLANLVTFDAYGDVAVGRYVTLEGNLRYNPFEYKIGDDRHTARYRQFSASLGARWWPWHIFSGWWMSAKGRYQVYNIGGFSSPATREGERYGGGLGAGYTYMVNPHFNLEFGVGGWMGADKYVKYDCPTCGVKTDEGTKFFILPADMLLGLVYVF